MTRTTERGLVNQEGAGGAGCKPWSGSFDLADHPERVVGRLEGSGLGCQWLIHRFGELEAILLSGEVWHSAERFRAFRPLRIHPSDAYVKQRARLALGSVPGASTSEPGASLAKSGMGAVPVDDLPELEETDQRAIRHRSRASI